ncbi:hypothetical protein [Streptomyces alboflavus]|uniref:hypothetical protein n=1 Tax=Streptomyces alboflavus TaxID=67267 RepID=UPI0036BCB9ED
MASEIKTKPRGGAEKLLTTDIQGVRYTVHPVKAHVWARLLAAQARLARVAESDPVEEQLAVVEDVAQWQDVAFQHAFRDQYEDMLARMEDLDDSLDNPDLMLAVQASMEHYKAQPVAGATGGNRAQRRAAAGPTKKVPAAVRRKAAPGSGQSG